MPVASDEDEVSKTIILLDFNGHAWINAAIYTFKNKNKLDQKKNISIISNHSHFLPRGFSIWKMEYRKRLLLAAALKDKGSYSTMADS